MKKIGLFGGSFDPIHFGHLHLAIQMKEYYHLDEVWFIPAFSSPFKKEAPLEGWHRLNMIQLAIQDLPYAKIKDFELQRATPSYTIDTITHFKAQFPDYQFFLILADDTIPSLHLWKDIHKIVTLVTLIIGRRECVLPESRGSFEVKQAILKGLTPLTYLIQIESKMIRKRIQENLYTGHLLPKEVLSYIKNHLLYTHCHAPKFF